MDTSNNRKYIGNCKRDHLFISYAVEDRAIADWIAMRLIAAGYKVWYDRFKMLGGESYPRDISQAIQKRCFRLIALLSRNSIRKENPLKERTLAINVGKNLGIDFLIPLKIDDIQPSEFDFLVSDIVFIQFNKSWYEGFLALMKKLQQLKTPKNQVENYSTISTWMNTMTEPLIKEERIWSNLFPVTEYPLIIEKRKVPFGAKISHLIKDWPHFYLNDDLWSFSVPEEHITDPSVKPIEFEYSLDNKWWTGVPRNVVSALINQSLKYYSLKRGLIEDPLSGRIYFPDKLLKGNKLQFRRYDGTITYVNACGLRNFKSRKDGKYISEPAMYHLSPGFKFLPDEVGVPVIRVIVGIFFNDPLNGPFSVRASNRRRKALAKGWWNYEWYARVLAIANWLTNSKSHEVILYTKHGNLTVEGTSLYYTIDFGIQENEFLGASSMDFNEVEAELEEDDGPSDESYD